MRRRPPTAAQALRCAVRPSPHALAHVLAAEGAGLLEVHHDEVLAHALRGAQEGRQGGRQGVGMCKAEGARARGARPAVGSSGGSGGSNTGALSPACGLTSPGVAAARLPRLKPGSVDRLEGFDKRARAAPTWMVSPSRLSSSSAMEPEAGPTRLPLSGLLRLLLVVLMAGLPLAPPCRGEGPDARSADGEPSPSLPVQLAYCAGGREDSRPAPKLAPRWPGACRA